MKVTTEPREHRQMGLTIEVEPEQAEAALARAAKRLAQKYKIPGFRPGKAPRSVVERTVGRQALYEEVIDELGPKLYREAIEQHDLDPYGPGEMEDIQLDPLVLKMIVPLQPDVDLGDYRSLRVPHEPPTVDEHGVEHQLEHIRENQAIIEPAGDVPADDNMVARLDIESTVEGTPFMNQKGANISLAKPLDPDETGDVFDFTDQIIGMRPGEDKAFDVTVPDTDSYGELRGKTAEFRVHLIELKQRELPAFDDALAQTVGDYETLDALKAAIRSELLAAAERQAESDYSDRVIDELVRRARVEYPPQMVESEIDALLERTEKRMQDQNLTLEEYLKALGKSRDEYREELRPTAEVRLRRGLVLNQVIKNESLKVSDEDVNKQIEAMAEVYGPRADEARQTLSSGKNREAIVLDLLSRAGVARLVAIAKGEAPALHEPAIVLPSDSAPAQPGNG